MLPLNKDSTISSKVSEYDNVPVLPINYHNHVPAPFPASIDDLSPVPQHRSSLSSSSTFAVSTVSPSYSLQCEESASATPRLLQFPTEENQLPFDTEKKQQQQQHARLNPSLLPQDGLQDAYRQNRQQAIEMSSRHSATTHQHLQHNPCRSHRESYGGEMGTGASMVFYFLVFLAEILMFGLLSLVLFWVVYYRGGFAWREDVAKEFNYHPVLMITGFIFFMGHAMLVYRLYRCCNKLTAKILHTFLYLMAVPCIVVGTITVFDSHNLKVPPIPNLYSLHSWLGVVTIGLFALQLVVGFFSFWILLCCEQGTAKFRAGLVPVHATFGIITFMLAIATAVTGYTEKAIFSLSNYSQMPDEAWVINTQATCLAGLAILMGFLLYSSRYARSRHPVAIVDPPSRSHYVMAQKNYYYRETE